MDSIDIHELLVEMRKSRMGLIQATDQLRFSYQAIIEGMLRRLADEVSTFTISHFKSDRIFTSILLVFSDFGANIVYLTKPYFLNRTCYIFNNVAIYNSERFFAP